MLYFFNRGGTRENIKNTSKLFSHRESRRGPGRPEARVQGPEATLQKDKQDEQQREKEKERKREREKERE